MFIYNSCLDSLACSINVGDKLINGDFQMVTIFKMAGKASKFLSAIKVMFSCAPMTMPITLHYSVVIF